MKRAVWLQEDQWELIGTILLVASADIREEVSRATRPMTRNVVHWCINHIDEIVKTIKKGQPS